jgi:anti-sigma B factor antagonist
MSVLNVGRSPDEAGVRLTTDLLEDGTVVVVVEGEIDLNTADKFESALAEAFAASTSTLVDLTDCTFLDSSALRVLVNANKHLDGAGPLSLVIPESHVLKVFQITHLDGVFKIQRTRA